MGHMAPISRRRPRSIVVGITYVALGVIIGTAITFGVRGWIPVPSSCSLPARAPPRTIRLQGPQLRPV